MSEINEEVDDRDPFEKFASDLAATKEIIRKTSASPENLKAHIIGTMFPIIEELAALMAQARDGMFDHFEERINSIESGDTTIYAEDAEKFLGLAAGAQWLCDELRKRIATDATVPGDMKDKISAIAALATECVAIVESSRVEDDEDDEDERDNSKKQN